MNRNSPPMAPVDAIDGLALVDARDTLEEIKRGITALRFSLDALQTHVENMGAQLDPIPNVGVAL
ncbi:MAG: hypothetical protein HIU90_17125 [Proteobacteria bacterium]|nr:hypothetical protein [Pseudomonadota bacterium]